MTNPLRALHEVGQSVWYDNISRDLLRSGALARLIHDDGIRGVTSNPSIFQKAMSAGVLYDDDIRRLAAEGKSVPEIYQGLAVADIRAGADLLRPLFEESGGEDGYISLEVSPWLANESSATIEEGKRLFEAADRPNLMIKVPATPAGIPAITALIGAGVNVNVTLIFSLDMYEQVMRAYLQGLEILADGGSVAKVASVASFFVSRVDTVIDKQLAGRPEERELQGRAGIANAKLAYARFQRVFQGPLFEKQAKMGARVQRPLWASTSTKNPAYSDTMYAEALIGPHTVDTMPPQTVDAFRDHGVARVTVTEGVDEAQAVIDRLAAMGIDMGAVTAQLLEEGVKLFSNSFEQLMAGLEAKVGALQRAR